MDALSRPRFKSQSFDQRPSPPDGDGARARAPGADDAAAAAPPDDASVSRRERSHRAAAAAEAAAAARLSLIHI